jgi:DNA-binding sugar fermentation-stimulating protein
MAAPKENKNAEVIIKLDKKEFNYESEFCDYLEDNIENVCNDLLNEKYISHIREYYISKSKRKYGKSKRVDFLIKTNKGNILCEVKKPTDHYMQLLYSISQIEVFIITQHNLYKINAT